MTTIKTTIMTTIITTIMTTIMTITTVKKTIMTTITLLSSLSSFGTVLVPKMTQNAPKIGLLEALWGASVASWGRLGLKIR